ncbi:type I polyketide synthase [Vibrio nigripulchritudo]|uniref:type I polyketide synthase n=1 Tax=Vibrio nigripulchritudo TaxID=28173 RepID=UPI0022868AEE|nr:type I polyketide synthase [Vibrio nigripulchritudo]
MRGTAVNQDGASASMTAPNGKAQEAVIQQALNEAELDGKDIHYVECHGTGTPLGDPIEVGALKATLGAGRQSPLVLSSLKSNIGHLEGAAGVAGLIKAIEVVRRRQAPGVAHFSTLNPNIDVTDFDVVISKDTTALPASGPVYAGISSFGFGGTNAHAIISSYEGSRPYEVRPVPYQRSFLPWRRLPNPLLSRTIGEGIGASLRGELGALWQDHRIQNRVLVPAASHLTMLSGLSLVKESQTMSCVGAERVVMHQPVEVTGEEGLEIRCLKEGKGARLEFGVNGEWHNAVSAGYIGRTERPVLADGFPGIESVRSRCEFSTYDERYHRLAERGVEFGSRYQNLEQLYFGNKEGLGYIRVDAGEPIERGQTLLSSPALDAGIQLLGLCGMESDQVYVPYSLKKISLKVLDAQPTTLCAYVTLTETGQDGIEGDVYLLGEDGECYAALSGLVCRPWRQQDPVSDSLYEVDWQMMAQPVGVEASGVVMSRKEPGTLPSGWRYTTVNSGADLSPVLTESASLPEQTTLAFLSQGDKEDSVLGLSMLQQLSALGYKGKVLFVLNPASKESAGLAGLVKSAQQECPALPLQCVDAAPHHIHRVLSEASAFPDESHLRLTEQGTWESARLRRYHRDDTAPLKIREHATYVISGGHGALGQVAAEYLIDQGAKHLVLLSRRDIPESEWSEALLTLKGHARIESMVCDVSVEEEVSSLSDRLWQGDWPAVAGVIHTAGVLTDGTLSNQNAEKIAQACSVKVEGAEHLKRWLSPRDFMWLYSSAASVFGSMAQGSYALANSQLDHLARTWQGQGAAILSIQWGAWSNGGMAVRHGAVERAHAAGYGSINNALGLKVLDRLLSDRTEGSVCVCPLEWDRVSMTDSLVSDWVVRPQTVVSDAPVNEAEVVVTDTWSKDGIREVVREAAKKAMGKAVSDTASLMANGLDSLNAVVLAQELSQSFDLSLGAIFALNHPTIEDMVTELEKDAPKRNSVSLVKPVAQLDANNHVTEEHEQEEKEMVVASSTSRYDVAVVSTACRLPGGIDSADVLWEKLVNKTDCVTTIPSDRMTFSPYYDPNPDAVGKSYTNKGAFVDGVEFFDNAFFGIPLAEAKAMDPQQRMLLEVSCEAFYQAGYEMETLRGRSIGVFVGQMGNDWAHMHKDDQLTNPYFGAGSSSAITSNRLSYIYGLRGPSMTIDTACSSSLVAIDLAVEKLANGSCEAALVGGVNLMLSHRSFVGCCAAKMLSYEGRCASFDESADGYCRGEGIGAVVLKRLEDAQRDNDDILAVIKGSAVNQDGQSATLTAPNGKAQEDVISSALERAGLSGRDLDYVECHGTGTPLGDPIEMGALKHVTQEGREKPLVVGTIKSNMGHLEGAAGIAGFIKAVEVVRHRYSPGIVHLQNLNPKINLDGSQLKVSSQGAPLPREKVRAGVSSFGFGGTNAHVILESYGAPTESSAKTETENAVEYATMLFTGQGSLFSGCARSLYEKEPVFKQEFDRFTDYLDTLGVAVKDLLLVQSDRHNQMLTQTNIQQPALVSLQLAQLALWRARGVHPEKVLGHSVGEISAAVAAGILKTEDALKLVVMRSDFMFDCEFGGMAAVLVSAEKIESLPVDVVIAAENGPSLTVLAGPKGALQAYLSKHFSDNHINLPVSHAFHSPMMEPASKRLAAELTNIEFHPRKGNVRIFSTLAGREVNEEFASSRYWPEQMLASVKFLQATNALFDTYEPRSKVIELGGGNTLIGMTKRILPDLETTWVDSVNA